MEISLQGLPFYTKKEIESNRKITIYYDFEVNQDNSPNSIQGVRAISIGGELEKVTELDWFVRTLEIEFHIEADKRQISYEGSELYLHEIDGLLIPSDMLNGLPELLLFETMVFDCEDGTEWLGIVAMNIGTREWYVQIILQDGEPVFRKRIEKENEKLY